jgi:fermentation-respiration switch protein FrsA (DUF1100 family)
MLWSVLFIAVAAYLGLALLLYTLQERFVFLPTRDMGETPEVLGLAYQDVRFPASDGIVLDAWFVPGNASAPTVLFFHGNAGNISHRLDSLAVFHRLGLNTLIVDYRGYGRSQGRPSEAGTYRDAEAAWRYLRTARGLVPRDIVLFGRSLGAAVATRLATEVHPAALIIESTFTSVPDLAAKLYPFLPGRLLARIRYDTKARIAHVDCPVLIVHSRDDEMIPFEQAERLYAAAREPKRLLALHGRHNDAFLTSAAEYRRGLTAFLNAYAGYEPPHGSRSAANRPGGPPETALR